MEPKNKGMGSEESGISSDRKNRSDRGVNESPYIDRSQTPSREHQGGRRDKGNLGEESGNVQSDRESNIGSDFDTGSSSRQ